MRKRNQDKEERILNIGKKGTMDGKEQWMERKLEESEVRLKGPY